MIKPQSLRDAIEAALPAVRRNPDKLLIYIEGGSLRCTAAASLSFEYSYTLNVTILDYGEHADTLMVPVLAWVARNQPELLANPDRQRDGITFEADLLNRKSMDIAVRLQLTERVVVKALEGGGYEATHVPEPPLDPDEAVESWTLTIQHPDGTEEPAP